MNWIEICKVLAKQNFFDNEEEKLELETQGKQYVLDERGMVKYINKSILLTQ